MEPDMGSNIRIKHGTRHGITHGITHGTTHGTNYGTNYGTNHGTKHVTKHHIKDGIKDGIKHGLARLPQRLREGEALLRCTKQLSDTFETIYDTYEMIERYM